MSIYACSIAKKEPALNELAFFGTRQALLTGYSSDSPVCSPWLPSSYIYIISYVQTMKIQIKNQPLRTEAGRAPLASPSSYLNIISYFGTKSFLFQYNRILFPMQELARI